jgi:hypothetical protein
MITKPKLNTKPTAGVIGAPVYAGDTTIISTKSASTKGPTGLNGTYDHTDRAKKWERPHPQDVPEKGKNQYTRHD